MTDEELIIWQDNQAAGSAQYSMAEREWQRRLVVKQVKATHFAAWVGLAGVIIGALLGWGLPRMENNHRNDETNQRTRAEHAEAVNPISPVEAKPLNSAGPRLMPPPKSEGASSAAQQKK